jgi:hypothetical protein
MASSTTIHEYDVTGPLGFTLTGVDRRRAAQALRVFRTTDLPCTVVHHERVVRDNADQCRGCRARNATIEDDCDGPYTTVSCDSPQCDWWAAVEAREADKRAGCPERMSYPDHDERHNCR